MGSSMESTVKLGNRIRTLGGWYRHDYVYVDGIEVMALSRFAVVMDAQNQPRISSSCLVPYSAPMRTGSFARIDNTSKS
jgi:hypothetical protein